MSWVATVPPRPARKSAEPRLAATTKSWHRVLLLLSFLILLLLLLLLLNCYSCCSCSRDSKHHQCQYCCWYFVRRCKTCASKQPISNMTRCTHLSHFSLAKESSTHDIHLSLHTLVISDLLSSALVRDKCRRRMLCSFLLVEIPPNNYSSGQTDPAADLDEFPRRH